MVQNFKTEVLALITRLSDRDTYVSAVAELESMARKLDSSSSIQTFILAILSIGSEDKLAARRHCLHLVSLLSLLYPSNVTPHLPKILAFILRRLRDSDSSIIRPQCAATSSSLAKNLTKAGFLASFVKPLSEALFTEQELNSHLGVAMCLSAAMEASGDPEAEKWGRPLLAKLVRFLKFDGYKWKVGALTVLGSVVIVGGVRGYSGLSELVGLLIAFLKNDDWATRRASAEALKRIAAVEKEAVAELKSDSLKAFEARRFDKVKATREVMSQMIVAWKQLPDVSVEASPPPKSVVSSGEDEIDGKPDLRTKSGNARKKISLDEKSKNDSRKAIHSSAKKKALSIRSREDTRRGSISEEIEENRGPISEDRESISQREAAGGAMNVNENEDVNRREGEDMCSIGKQLAQIQRQQSNIVSLVQSFMGTTQNGMRALESRVNGIEASLEELVQSAEKRERRGFACWFLRGKVKGLLKRRSSLVERINAESMNFERRRVRIQNGLDIISNPLAHIQTQAHH